MRVFKLNTRDWKPTNKNILALSQKNTSETFGGVDGI